MKHIARSRESGQNARAADLPAEHVELMTTWSHEMTDWYVPLVGAKVGWRVGLLQCDTFADLNVAGIELPWAEG